MKKVLQAAVIFWLLSTVAPAAQAFTCAGKQLGNYCDGKTLVTCAYGEMANAIYCTAGCLAQGSNSKCDKPECDNFCCNKALGNYCDGKTLVTCAYDEVANEIDCQYGCVPGGSDVQCKDPPECNNFCCKKALGNYCDGKTLVTCAYDEVSNTINCPDGCLSQGSNSKCDTPDCTGFCCTRTDGVWCHNNLLWACKDGVGLGGTPCAAGCDEGAGPNASCQAPDAVDPDFCIGKAGYYCYQQNTVVYCKNHQVSGLEQCLSGCDQDSAMAAAACVYEVPNLFCADHADGAWCNGSSGVTICQGGTAMEHVPCPSGCARTPPGEADFCLVPDYCAQPSVAPGPLGVTVDPNCCPHFSGTLVQDVPAMAQNTEGYQSIKLGTSSKSLWGNGCMVTSFSMFYEHEGFQRTLQGEILENTPANENAWRTHNVQGYTCCSDMDCEPAGYKNKYCALWNANPTGFGQLLPVYNAPAGPCLLEVETAADIASVLNSGSVMLAFVKGQSTNQHWVLVVGVDADGTLLINDPWDGHKAAPIDGEQGPAPYHALPMLLVRDGSGGSEPLGDGGTPKSAALGDQEGPLGVTQFTDEGKAEFLEDGTPGTNPIQDVHGAKDIRQDDTPHGQADVVTPGEGAEASGCGVGSPQAAPHGSWLLLAALYALLRRHRRSLLPVKPSGEAP